MDFLSGSQAIPMAMHCEHTVDVPQTTAAAFALIDDLARTPEWLAPCTAIEKVTPGANAKGQRLVYRYRQGGRAGVMDGTIEDYVPGQRIVCRYVDRMMDVKVDLRVASHGTGARLTHRIEITPRTFFARLLSPLIRRSLPKQTTAAMAALAALLQKGNAAAGA